MSNLRKPLIFLVVFIPLMVILSAYMKVTGSAFAIYFLEATLIFNGIFVALCLIDIYREKTLSSSEKWMYAVAVVFLNALGGILYLLRPARSRHKDRLKMINSGE